MEHRILFVEDVATDMEMAERLLRKSGFKFVSLRVENEVTFRAAISDFEPTLIVSDYKMPGFNGLEALRIALNQAPDLPFIILTGAVNEDVAVKCIKAGADDYVIKQNLKRFVPAVESAIEKKKLRKAKVIAEQKRAETEMRYQMLVENQQVGIFLINNGSLEFVNKQFTNMTGYSINNLKSFKQGINSNDVAQKLYQKALRVIDNGIDEKWEEFQATAKSGEKKHWEVYFTLVTYSKRVVVQGVLIDITEKHELNEKLYVLSRAIEQSPVSIVITNENADIEYANPFFEEITGYSPKEVMGKNPRIFQSGRHNQDFYKQMWGELLNGNSWYGEFLNKKKDGTLFWEQASISPVVNNNGRIEHFVAVKEDVTDKKQVLSNLEQAKKQAEESSRLKTSFLQNISHEIRTPMNGIMGFADLLKRRDLPESKQQEFVDAIYGSGERMLAIINDLIDISKIETGQLTINDQQVGVNQMLYSIYQLYELQAEKKNIRLTLDLKIDEVFLLTDETRLHQVMSNLINNALKFTPEGEVEFGYTINENGIEFFVNDTGIGISKHIGEKLFDRFVQEDSSLHRQFEGTGLGLSISRELVNLMGGTIRYASQKNKGTTFFVTFPIEKVSKMVNEHKAEVSGDTSFSELSILVAEDDEVSAVYLSELFEGFNVHIDLARNGQEAVEAVKVKKSYDLILMDLKMPLMDGYSATRSILEMNPKIPIVAQTAFAQEKDRNMAREAGCVDFIAKPIVESELLRVLAKYAVH